MCATMYTHGTTHPRSCTIVIVNRLSCFKRCPQSYPEAWNHGKILSTHLVALIIMSGQPLCLRHNKKLYCRFIRLSCIANTTALWPQQSSHELQLILAAFALSECTVTRKYLFPSSPKIHFPSDVSSSFKQFDIVLCFRIWTQNVNY